MLMILSLSHKPKFWPKSNSLFLIAGKRSPRSLKPIHFFSPSLHPTPPPPSLPLPLFFFSPSSPLLLFCFERGFCVAQPGLGLMYLRMACLVLSRAEQHCALRYNFLNWLCILNTVHLTYRHSLKQLKSQKPNRTVIQACWSTAQLSDCSYDVVML